jgi:predicted O-linked N-acetylglucosamine transferase (SPINDLY family)
MRVLREEFWPSRRTRLDQLPGPAMPLDGSANMTKKSPLGSKVNLQHRPARAQPKGSAILSSELASTFSYALALHRAGQLSEAGEMYRHVLKARPRHFDSLHLLGVVYHQRGDHAQAVRQIEAALRINPNDPFAHCNHAAALLRMRSPSAAVASYDQAIALKPDLAEAFHCRGNALQDLKQFEAAVASYDRAIAIKPDYPEAFNNRGVALQALYRFDGALASYDRAIALKSDYAEAYNNRGNVLKEAKQFEQALASYHQALKLMPRHAAALSNRSVPLLAIKRFDEALASCDQAIALKPDYAEAFYNRANALRALKRRDEALESFEQAIVLKPDYAAAYNNRGLVLQDMKRPEEALASYDQAIALEPHNADAFYNRGNALGELKRFDEAVASYDRAIALELDTAKFFNNRGNALQELRRFDEAVVSYDRAVALAPDYLEAFNNRGVALHALKRLGEAVASYDRVVALNPEYGDGFINRSIALQEMKRFREAAASYDRALTLVPDYRYGFTGLAECVIKLCDWRRQGQLAAEVRRQVIEHKSCIYPFLLLGYSDDASLQLTCAQNYIQDQQLASPPSAMCSTVWLNGKIKIAYISSNFRSHASNHLAELFERHDRSRFEVVGISSGPDDGSAMRARLAAAFDQFIDAGPMSDQAVAQWIGDRRIDIAVDLIGHTHGARTGIFAYRPAPIQINYNGFPGTIGADFIDYIIADATILPFEQQPNYSERIVHLPDCYWVNDRKYAVAEHTPTRLEVGLPASGFVFCCFNNSWKLTPAIFDVWMRLLKAVEGSVLWLIRDSEDAEANLRNEATVRGVDPARLVFAPRLSPSEHLARHRLADLFLDTLPCNAHTTTTDALWTGLPVLTCLGKTFAGRVAASMLNAIGLSELVTYNQEEYELLALRLATDRTLMRAIR